MLASRSTAPSQISGTGSSSVLTPDPGPADISTEATPRASLTESAANVVASVTVKINAVVDSDIDNNIAASVVTDVAAFLLAVAIILDPSPGRAEV